MESKKIQAVISICLVFILIFGALTILSITSNRSGISIFLSALSFVLIIICGLIVVWRRYNLDIYA